jgi:phosphoglycerate dehydrogenase-like enzyme
MSESSSSELNQICWSKGEPMIRVGVEEAIDDALLKGFTRQVKLVRIPEQLDHELKIDFWIPPLSSTTVNRQWPYLKGVRVVQSVWAGVDSLLKLISSGVILCDAQGVHNIPTAEWAVSAILTMQKYIPFYVELQRQHDWAGRERAEEIYLLSEGAVKGLNLPVLTDEVADATVLIVGYGAIGKAIEERLVAFGPRFLRVARSPREGVYPVSKLDEFLGQADIVVVITPLTSETRHLLDSKRLAKMKRGALLVNVARGPIVDTDALLQALNEKRIRAAIDVTDPEPLPPEHPLWKAPNLLITPHVAGDSAKFLTRAFKLASEQAERYARGEALLNVVTGEY